jgi:hypothetical protein
MPTQSKKSRTTAVARRPKTAKPDRSTRLSESPLLWREVDRWLALPEDRSQWRKANVDDRLFLVAPAFRGILKGLKAGAWAISPADRAVMLKLARRASPTATYAPASDLDRVLIVSDWMVRCALPLWLDRLPRWCEARKHGDTLRGLQEVLWTQQIVDAIAALSPLWISLKDAATDRGTAQERRAVEVAHRQASIAMQVMSFALARQMNQIDASRDGWTCENVMQLLRAHHYSERDATIMETFQAVIEVLLVVQHGDSRRSIADRCVWPMAKRRAA